MRPTWNPNGLNKELLLANAGRVIINRLVYVGENAVKVARESGAYNDITGNLRASIGFAVLHNGLTVAEGGFETDGNGSDKATGVRQGRALIDRLAIEYSNGYVLIVVAGMQYAAAVEVRGKDVLTGASIDAKYMLNQLFKAA